MIDTIMGMATDWPMGTVLFGLIAFLGCFLIGLIVVGIGDHITASYKTERVLVIDKFYESSHTSTGVGPSISGNGGVAVTTSHNPEKYHLQLEGYGMVAVWEEAFMMVDRGKTYSFTFKVGGWTGSHDVVEVRND